MRNRHIMLAIKQAKKEGNKGVQSITGGADNNIMYTKLINEGKLEVFSQKYAPYEGCEGFSERLLMRIPKK